MYPNDFLAHITSSLRQQLELKEQEKETLKDWVLTTMERLEKIKNELQRRY